MITFKGKLFRDWKLLIGTSTALEISSKNLERVFIIRGRYQHAADYIVIREIVK